MELNIVNEVAALQRLSVGQLRQRFAELFGETTQASNRTWLVKRIAWRMQALAQAAWSDGSCRNWVSKVTRVVGSRASAIGLTPRGQNSDAHSGARCGRGTM